MKRILSLALTTILATSLLAGCGAKKSDDHLARIKEAGKITIATEGVWAPFTYHDPDTDELVGFDVEVAAAIAEKLGVTPEFKEVAKTFDMDYMICHKNSELETVLKSFFEKEDRVLLEIEERLDDPVTPKVSSRMNEDGSFSTPSLEDMAPFISKEEHDKWMIKD